METKTMLKLAAATVVGGVVYSEIAHHVERKITPISEETSILPHEIFPGPTPDAPALFFLHGWPDDLLLFRRYAQELSKTYFCVNCTLPGYPTPESFAGEAGTMPKRNWGFDFDEAARALRATIALTCAGHMDDVGVTLVMHDWGCILGNLLVDEYFNTPGFKLHRMVNMDVGALSNGLNAGVFLMCVAYQAPLNLFWMLPERLGNALTALESWILLRTEPPSKDKPSAVTAGMNWPYRTAWREVFSIGRKSISRALEFKPRAGVPILFLCSQDRPEQMRFCDQEYIRLVRESTPLSRTEFMPGNHWFPNQYQNETLEITKKWLEDTHSFRAKL